MPEANSTADILTGTVKGPGELPHEYLFITADNGRARIGEVRFYLARGADEARHILGNITSRRTAEVGSGHIGSLLTRSAGEVPVVLSIKDVVSTHLAILASTGAGKSYTAGVLVEELMRPYNRASVLIVDPHGEYDTLRSIEGDARFHSDDGSYHPEVKIFTHDRIRVRVSTLTEADIK